MASYGFRVREFPELTATLFICFSLCFLVFFSPFPLPTHHPTSDISHPGLSVLRFLILFPELLLLLFLIFMVFNSLSSSSPSPSRPLHTDMHAHKDTRMHMHRRTQSRWLMFSLDLERQSQTGSIFSPSGVLNTSPPVELVVI